MKFPQADHPFADIEDVESERVLSVQDLRSLHTDLLALPVSRFEQGDLKLLLALNDLETQIAAGSDRLVKKDEFEEYAREYVEETYDLSDWIARFVKWDALATSMAIDYVEIEFLGRTYLCR